MNIELTFCHSTTHLLTIDNEGVSLPIKLHSSFHVFLGKDKCYFVLVCLTSPSMTVIHLLWKSEQSTMNLLTLHPPVHFSLIVSEA